MKTKRSRLALTGVLALALSVTVFTAVGADAAKKKKTKSGNVTITKVINQPIPDRAAPNGAFGRLDVPLQVGKKFKKRVVAADSVSVTFQTTGSAPNAAGDLEFWLQSPKGRTTSLFPDNGSIGGQNVGPLTLTSNSPVGLCNDPTPPCDNPFQTLNRPFAGTVGDSYLAIYTGTRVAGEWRFIVLDTEDNGETSTLNSVRLQITTAAVPAA
jgi:hypothetical protein